MFAALEPLVILITREELVAMAKVTTDFPGSLVLQVAQVYSNITLARLPVTNCKPVTSLSRTVSAAEEVEDGAEEHGVYYLRPNDQRSRLKM